MTEKPEPSDDNPDGWALVAPLLVSMVMESCCHAESPIAPGWLFRVAEQPARFTVSKWARGRIPPE